MRRKQNTKKQDVLFILVSSFIVVVAWISFNIYHIWITSTVSQAVQMQLTPISPTFDQATIQQLKSREDITPVYSLQSQPKVASRPAQQAQQALIPPDLLLPASESSRFAPSNTAINRQGQ